MAEKLLDSIKNMVYTYFSARSIRIESIVLFGSYGTPSFTEDSDIDLIVLSEAFKGKTIFEKVKMTDGLEWSLIKQFKKPFDILYYSPEEWETSEYLAISEARNHGVVL